MKRLVVFCLTLMLFASCSVDDDSTSFSFEVLPVESVDIPDEFELGETYPITVSYLRPSTCHGFKEFYYLKENNELSQWLKHINPNIIINNINNDYDNIKIYTSVNTY